MLPNQEEKFIVYWEKNRLRRKKTMRQFLLGIPAGLLIVVPIMINFSSGWYRRANMEANSQDFNPMVLFVALLFIVGFTAIFWQKHQWDQLEQRYRELLARRAKKMPPVAGGAGPTAESGAGPISEPFAQPAAELAAWPAVGLTDGTSAAAAGGAGAQATDGRADGASAAATDGRTDGLSAAATDGSTGSANGLADEQDAQLGVGPMAETAAGTSGPQPEK